MTTQHTISECLAALEISTEDLEACGTLQLEFAFIKKAYFKKVLVCHPDKGGDAAVFRTVHASFEALRDMYDNERVEDSFVTSSTSMDDTTWQEFADMPTQSYDFFYAAAEEDMPLYCVELAKSGRSGCKQKGKTAKKCVDPSIGMGEIRCGSLDDFSGGYGRWNHLKCWRVPSKIWLGLPDPEECDDPELFAKAILGMNEVLLCGFNKLPQEDKDAFVEHLMDKGNWAALRKRRQKKNDAAMVATGAGNETGDSKDLVGEGYHVQREHFVPPVPGKNGAVAGVLKGKTVVLTGTFPEVGGGKGLNLGKAKVKALVESFGGRVTGSISGKTDLLLIGKDPGRAKVMQAEAAAKCMVIELKALKDVLEGTSSLEEALDKPIGIRNFSAGYPGAKAITADTGPMLLNNTSDADGDKKPAAKRKRLEDDGDKKPAAKKRKGKKVAARKAKKAVEEKENLSEDGNVSEDENEDDAYNITCDLCGVDCTEKSWFFEAAGQDFCATCRDGRGVPQRNGVNV